MSSILIQAPPTRSTAQCLEALQHANLVRGQRARFKREMKAGGGSVLTVVGALVNPPDWILSMKVYDLLLSIPHWGRVKANHALRVCEMSPSKTVGGISSRQRRALLLVLGVKVRRHDA